MTQTSAKQIKWRQKSFSELTNTELFDLYKLRVSTFVVAQKRIYQEVDEQDPVAIHILGYDGYELVAYSRVFRTGDTVTFGRVVTAQSHRGIGLGNYNYFFIPESIHYMPNDKNSQELDSLESVLYG